jgi:ubiquinol-cytochrome c reductase cytochrome c subunit
VTSQWIRIAFVALAVLPLAGPARADDRSQVAKGRDLYVARCVSCHGSEAQGVSPTGPPVGAGDVRGAGPPLRGVGALAADFYLQTGYMPLGNASEQPRRGKPAYPQHEIRELVAYIGSLGGPGIPRPQPERGHVADGLRLFTENCAGCHQIAGEGGVVTNVVAPNLKAATPVQIAEAVRIGPYVMPRFSRRQLSDRELDSIIAYVRQTQHPDDRGGWGIGHIGPVPEGLVAWLIAGTALLLAAGAIGGRAR